MNRLAIATLLAAALLLDPTAQAGAKTTTPRPIIAKTVQAPSAVCDTLNAGDLEIIDGTWFECVCERLPFTGDLCDWYEITSPAEDPMRLKTRALVRWIKTHRLIGRVLTVRQVIA